MPALPILKLPEDNNGSIEPPENNRGNRRNSLAATLHANFGNTDIVVNTRRRLSNVGDAVTRHISRWRNTTVATKEVIVSQGYSICVHYIRSKMKRSGIFHRKVAFKRMGSSKAAQNQETVNDAALVLIEIGKELERMFPDLYTGIARQTGFGTFSTEQEVTKALTEIGREIFNSSLHPNNTWSKVAAFYSSAGGIAVDCVRQGHEELISGIRHAVLTVLDEAIAPWVIANGGWEAIILKYRPPPEEEDVSLGWYLSITLITITLIIVLLIGIRYVLT